MEYELPLLELFNRLREAGLPLGIDEYELVLRALQGGFGIQDKTALAKLCCTLWVKTSEEKLLFDYHFERVMIEDALVFATKSSTAANTDKSSGTIQKNSLTASLFKIPHLTRYLVLGSTIVLATGIIVSLVNSLMKNRCPNFTSQPIEYAVVNKEYKYDITTCGDNNSDHRKITPLEKPDWLKFKDNGDGTATLNGTLQFSGYGKVDLWDSYGKLIATFSQQGEIERISFSPDGRFLANVLSNTTEPSASKSPYTVEIWDISARKQFNKLEYPARITSINFSPNGQYIVTTLEDGTVRINEISGKQQLVPLPYKQKVTSVSFSSDGQRIATASGDGTARLWSLKGSQQEVLWHKGRVTDVRFSPDGQYLATNSDDGKSNLWKISGQKLLKTFPSQGDSKTIVFTNDGKRLVNTSDKRTISIWDIFSGKLIAKLNHPSDVRSFILSFDGKYLTSYHSNRNSYIKGKISLWETSGKLVKELDLQNLQKEQQTNYLYDVTLNPDGKSFAAFSSGGVILWDIITNTNKELYKIDNSFPYPALINFSFDGQVIAIASNRSTDNVVLQVTNASGEKPTQKFSIRLIVDIRQIQTSKIDIVYVTIAGLVILFLLFGGYIAFRSVDRRKEDRDIANEKNQKAAKSTTDLQLPPEPTSLLEDEMQVAKAVRQEVRKETDSYLSPFSTSNEYFPVTRRQMKQSWRYLRRFVREGIPSELDIDATVREISRQGVLLKPVFVPRRVNRTELIILIDQDGSMVPYHALSRRLAETALQGGRLGKSSIYYFHNCPSQYLYNDPNHQKARLIRDIFAQVNLKNTKVLIISDAGAARGALNPERVEITAAFLNYLSQKVRYIAWLNPLPSSRWYGTSAGEIANLVPMFEFNRRGLDTAIGVLRGQLIYVNT